MSFGVFRQFTALLQSTPFAVYVANCLAQEYALATKHPEYYTKFNADDGQKVGISWAGMAALAGAVGEIAILKRGDLNNKAVSEAEWTSALNDIKEGNLTAVEADAAERAANTAWRAIQAMRDMRPILSALERPINMAFELLPPDMLDLDLVVIRRAAREVWSKLQDVTPVAA